MKKYILVLGLATLGTAANAQTMAGGKLGLNYNIYSSKAGDDAPDGTESESNSGIGFHVGGYFQYNFSDNIGIRPELLFSTRSTKSDLDDETSFTVGSITTTTKTTGETTSSLSYIEIPLLLAIGAGDNLDIHVGPGFGLLMGAKYKSEGDQTTSVTGLPDQTTSFDNEVSGEDAKEGLRGTEIGLCIGGVYNLESGLNFGLRYWRGLNTLNEDTDLYKTTANVIQLSIGWNFMDER